MEAYRPRLRRAALRLVKNESDADDIVQEAFVRWYTAPPPDTRCPEAWLVTVVRRLCIDAYRQKTREQLCDADALGRVASGKVVEFPRRLEYEDEFAVVLQHLSERATTEECLALLLREGFSYRYTDIALALNKSEQACRQLVHRGKCAAQGARPVRRSSDAVPRKTLAAFVNALQQGNIQSALAILAGITRAARATARRPECATTS